MSPEFVRTTVGRKTTVDSAKRRWTPIFSKGSIFLRDTSNSFYKARNCKKQLVKRFFMKAPRFYYNEKELVPDFDLTK